VRTLVPFNVDVNVDSVFLGVLGGLGGSILIFEFLLLGG
jgi:hypothetical protein